MDIIVKRNETVETGVFETSIRERLSKYFQNYPFLESIKVFLEAKNTNTKKSNFKQD